MECTFQIGFLGDSGGGGWAPLGSLTTAQKSPRPAVKNFHVLNSVIEPLHIGTNTNLDHLQVTGAGTHGWEDGLAQAVETGIISDAEVILVQGAQGGSHVATPDPTTGGDWYPGGAFLEKFRQRWEKTVSLEMAAGNVTLPAIFMSIGINCFLFGSSTANFKIGLVAFIANVRSIVGYAPVFIDHLPPAFNSYNQVINDVVAADKFLFITRTNDQPMIDAYHWSSVGVREIALRKVADLLHAVGTGANYARSMMIADRSTRLGEPTRPLKGHWDLGTGAGGISDLATGVVTWLPSANASDGGAGRLDYAAAALPMGAIAKGAYDSTKPFTVTLTVPDTVADMSGVVVYLDDNPGPYYKYARYITSGYPFPTKGHIAQVFVYNGEIWRATGYVGSASTGVAAAAGDLIRLVGNGTDVVMSNSTDAGETWTTVYTFAGALTGKGLVYLKSMTAIANSARHVLVEASLQAPA